MKRILISVLSLLMVVTFLSACGAKKTGADGNASKDGAKLPVLRIFFSDETTPDKDMVAEAVSKITREKIGANVEFVMHGANEYAEKIPLLLASNEKMDIGYDAGYMGFVSRVKKNAYYDITELLKTKDSKLYSTIDPLLWKGVTIGGKIYGVPTYKELAEQWALYAETDFLAKNNIDTESIHSLEDAEVILKALKNDPSRPGFMITSKSSNQALYSARDYDSVTSLCSVKRDEPSKVVNYYETESYSKFVHLMRDWFNKGYIAQDVATLQNYNKYKNANGKQILGLSVVSYSPLNELAQEKTLGVKVTPMKVTPVVTTTSSTTGSVFGIYKQCENPELALKFLELWNTTPEIKNLITYGIEGKHYSLVNGKVKPVDNVQKLYYNQNWKSGNIFISYLLENEPDDKYEQYKKFNSQAIASPALGFTSDDTPVADKIAACNAVVKEYAPLLNCGAVDPDTYLPKFIASLKSAGSDAIVKEIQSQYANWQKE